MILGVGVDILEVSRISSCMDAGSPAFFRRVYSTSEQGEADSRADKPHYYTSRFAGKEAVLKCLGPVPERLRWNEIEILSGESGAPFVVRYPRGKGAGARWRGEPFEPIPVGRGRCLTAGERIAVLSIGPVGNDAARAVERARAEGIPAAHYDLRFAKPLDDALLDEVGRRFRYAITVEDGVVRGGVGSAVRDLLSRRGYETAVVSLGIPDDRFVEQGTSEQLHALCGFDEEGILKAIRQCRASQ